MVTIMTVGAAVSSGEFSDEIGARDAAKAVSVDSGGAALDMLLEKQVDLVIVDETLKDMSGLDLARQVAVKNPLAAVALVSPLSEEAFHETTEGLGLVSAQAIGRPGSSRKICACRPDDRACGRVRDDHQRCQR